GRAKGALLASYTQERHPIVLGVIATTDALTKTLSTHNPITSELRDAMIPIVTQIPMLHEAFVERMSGLGNTYKGSPIVEGGGRRYFDDSLRGGKGVDHRFILKMPRSAEPALAAGALEARFPDVLEVRADEGSDLRLVRPDGYLAYEGAPVQADLAKIQE